MEKINRVFFHELGHFVARELNCRLNDVPHPVAINIFPCPQNRDKYCGVIKFDPTVEQASGPVPRERLAESIAATTYGSFFQAYFENSTLEAAQKANGLEDLNYWAGALLLHSVDNQNIRTIEDGYFDYLLEKKALDPFMSIIPGDFLEQSRPTVFSVSIERLLNTIQPLLDIHFSDYTIFIQDLNQEILKTS